ncbi:MAG: DUF3108 domain-containing protein [Acidobacteria bacterium]|nr:DUF3108 domain-containing protein [Acidobacteriota bacterium]
MKIGRRCFVIFGIFLALLAAGTPAQEAEEKPLPFSPGETLTYDVSWSIFHAGEVTATLSKDPEGSRNAFVVKTTARSEGFVSILYKVRDDFESVFDPETLCSLEISKQINEGRRHRDAKIMFDGARGLAILNERNLSKPSEPPKHDEHKIPACVQDIVSGFYYLRSQPLRVGETIHLAVNDGSKTTQVAAAVVDREKIQTPLGAKDALRVEPRIFGTLYKKMKGRMLIWFSDDEHHYPLRIKAILSVGSITGTLTSISTTPPRDPSAGTAGSAAAAKAQSSTLK